MFIYKRKVRIWRKGMAQKKNNIKFIKVSLSIFINAKRHGNQITQLIRKSNEQGRSKVKKMYDHIT